MDTEYGHEQNTADDEGFGYNPVPVDFFSVVQSIAPL
jgi:hypothetical protein